ncbi:hypothetical protein [Bacillus sp. 165]|uniref:hypothetical protein n=1 Tax=Bacillus sp. 165 TaxID=1529117 RepID=UPI001ADB73CE|nr:hypothetical protein [Bacillus sp. 165]MBO9130751.1 hypothetical protein [Bacillus sp. 165]
MIKRIAIMLIALLIMVPPVTAEGKRVEIFDIKQKRVIQFVESSPDIQKEAERFLKGITDIYKKFDPIPAEGYMIRIPLEPSVMVQNQWMDALVNEVVVIFPKEGTPFLLVFDDENTTYFFIFNEDTDALLRYLKFNPKTL